MANFSLTPNRPNGQTPTEFPTSSLTIQQRLNLAHRRLRENDSRLQIVIRERDALLQERAAIEAEVNAAALCYRDARDAGRLAEQGAGAVAEACELWGVG